MTTSRPRYAARLAAYEPWGPRLGVLAGISTWDASMPRMDTGAAEITVPVMALRNASPWLRRNLATQGLELGVEVLGPLGWVEPDNARYIWTKRSLGRHDKAIVTRFTFQSLSVLLSKHYLTETAGLAEEQTKREFVGASGTPGAVMEYALTWAELQGGLHFDRTFTGTHDSNGQPWAITEDISFNLGERVDNVLRSLVERRSVEWRMVGRRLDLFNPNTLGRDLSSTVALHMGADIGDAPSEEAIDELAHRGVVLGAAGIASTSTNTAPSPYGQWMRFTSDERIEVQSDADRIASDLMVEAGQPYASLTRDVLPHAKALPFIDFGVFDIIKAPGLEGQGSYRVEQIMLRSDKGRLVIPVTFGSRIRKPAIRRAIQQQRNESQTEHISRTPPPATKIAPGTDLNFDRFKIDENGITFEPVPGVEFATLSPDGIQINDPAGTPILKATPDGGFEVAPWGAGGPGGGLTKNLLGYMSIGAGQYQVGAPIADGTYTKWFVGRIKVPRPVGNSLRIETDTSGIGIITKNSPSAGAKIKVWFRAEIIGMGSWTGGGDSSSPHTFVMDAYGYPTVEVLPASFASSYVGAVPPAAGGDPDPDNMTVELYLCSDNPYNLNKPYISSRYGLYVYDLGPRDATRMV